MFATIHLDDFEWPAKSSILVLKKDVEGFELNGLRSAEKLFEQQRVQHLIFEYTARWTERAPQKSLLSYVEQTLRAKQLHAVRVRRARTSTGVYS